MGKYYCLIAGLPNIALEDTKLAYSVAEFGSELSGILTSRDKKLIDWFYLKFDNRNLLAFLKNPESQMDERGTISQQEIADLYRAMKNEEKTSSSKRIPQFYKDFLRQYIAEEANDNKGFAKKSISWDDRLSALYYSHAMKCRNTFVADWFELNLNINNVLTAITCRKHQLDKAEYIVGDNEVAESIRTSNARNFGLGDSVEYLPELQRIAEEQDLLLREKKIDVLKWKWLDDHTFFKTFDIESVFAYLLKLEMIERWVTLDKVTGEQTFRQLVGSMKKGSINALEEFKKNN